MRVWSFAGDGGFQMNVQELQTVARELLPIKIAVANNRSLGMIRRYPERTFEGRTFGSVCGYSAPDFCKIADAYGLEHCQISSPGQLESVAAKLMRKALSCLRSYARSDNIYFSTIIYLCNSSR